MLNTLYDNFLFYNSNRLYRPVSINLLYHILMNQLLLIHILLALTHGCTSAVLFYLASTLDGRAEVDLVLSTWVRPDLEGEDWTPRTRMVWSNFQPAYLAALFLAMACLDHLATLLFQKTWQQDQQTRTNRLRWIEYLFSLSTMSILIGILCGALDIQTLSLFVVLSMATIAFGWLAEFLPNYAKQLNALGIIPFVGLWFFTFASYIASGGAGAPEFVHAIMATLFILEIGFGLVPFVLAKRPYAQTELAFCLLSLCAKQCLAWITYGGVASLEKRK